MNLGWNVRGRVSREKRDDAGSRSLRLGESCSIWPAMDLELFKADGTKLNEPAEDVGADSEQLTAQHKRDASAAGVFSLLFALSQHFIILLFGE